MHVYLHFHQPQLLFVFSANEKTMLIVASFLCAKHKNFSIVVHVSMMTLAFCSLLQSQALE